MIVVLGEILFDIFPDRMLIGGAPFNFAYHLKKFGFPVHFVSRVGRDAMGQRILDFIHHHGFDPDDIQKDDCHETGTVQVNATDEGHEFYITPDAAWDQIRFDDRLAELISMKPDLLYFGSLIQRTPSGRHLFRQLAGRDLTHINIFCDINLRKNVYTQETIHASMGLCNILKLNLEELAVASAPFTDVTEESFEKKIARLMKHHHIDEVILTMGSMGSQWTSKKETHYSGATPPEPFVDSVGAGDGYAAVAAAGYLKGLPVETTMALASRFSSYICSIKGALPPEEATIYDTLRNEIKAG